MRVSDYPLPEYACYIWHRGDGICVAWPDGGTLFLANSKLESHGWAALCDILAERRRVSQEGKKPQIGTSAEPTEQMLAAMLKGAKVSRVARSTEEDIFAEEFDAPDA